MTTPRAHRSAAVKAKDALDLAERKVARLEGRLSKANTKVTDLRHELEAAKVEREYAAKNPALTDILPIEQAP